MSIQLSRSARCKGLSVRSVCNTPRIDRSRSFKVTDFGTNRKLTYQCCLDSLAYNVTTISDFYWLTFYLTPFPSYGWLLVKFSLPRAECLTLTLSLGMTPCQYRHKWYIATYRPMRTLHRDIWRFFAWHVLLWSARRMSAGLYIFASVLSFWHPRPNLSDDRETLR